MRIAFIGKFQRLYDEEYIARSFEALGHDVLRLPNEIAMRGLFDRIDEFKPDICLYTKFEPVEGGGIFLEGLRSRGVKAVCWLFDLYFGYPRENLVYEASYFRADVVATTDGGHDDMWLKHRINHMLVRQGIYKPEAVLMQGVPEDTIVFVGADNALNEARVYMTTRVRNHYGDRFKWYGRKNTHELRGTDLNVLYAGNKIVVGDSVWSPNYWSNRVVETLGRGGFLIHVDVPGLKQEYPDIVTYERGNFDDLREKIDYYTEHEDERKSIVERNFNLVRSSYTMEHKCRDLLAGIPA